MTRRLAYLVPEFPGQTHSFFWNEVKQIEQLGWDVDIVSTRRPRTGSFSHGWTHEAESRTTYLVPPSRGWAKAALGSVGQIARSPRSSAQSLHVSAEPSARWVVSLPRRGAALLTGAELAWLGTQRRWSHIHVHSAGSSALIALAAHRMSGISYSLTLHGQLADYGPDQPEKWGHAAFGLVITRELAQRLAAEVPVAVAEAASVAPMGVDVAEFRRRAPFVPWRGQGALRIVSCARLNVGKGHDVLLRAVSLLRSHGVHVHLVIVGEDEQGGAGYRRHVESMISDLRLGDAVTLAGALPHERVREELEGSHVFALASHAEPLGVAIMEAMAMEMPVVVARSPGVSELIADGTGLMVPPARPDELANALSRVAREPELAVRMGAAARCRVEDSFSAARSAQILVARLDSLSMR